MHVCGNSFSFSKTFTSVCSRNTAHTNVCSEQIHLQTWRVTLSCSHKSFHSLCAQAAPKQMYSRIRKNTFLDSCWSTEILCLMFKKIPCMLVTSHNPYIHAGNPFFRHLKWLYVDIQTNIFHWKSFRFATPWPIGSIWSSLCTNLQ